jgi:hypothetical protein
MCAREINVQGSNNSEINESRFINIIKKDPQYEKESINCTAKFVHHLSSYSQLSKW